LICVASPRPACCAEDRGELPGVMDQDRPAKLTAQHQREGHVDTAVNRSSGQVETLRSVRHRSRVLPARRDRQCCLLIRRPGWASMRSSGHHRVPSDSKYRRQQERFRHFSNLLLHLVALHGRNTKPNPWPCHCQREQRRTSSLSLGDDWRSTTPSRAKLRRGAIPSSTAAASAVRRSRVCRSMR
jgi:hypothetical protein